MVINIRWREGRASQLSLEPFMAPQQWGPPWIVNGRWSKKVFFLVLLTQCAIHRNSHVNPFMRGLHRANKCCFDIKPLNYWSKPMLLFQTESGLVSKVSEQSQQKKVQCLIMPLDLKTETWLFRISLSATQLQLMNNQLFAMPPLFK